MGPKKILVKGLNFVNFLDDLDMGADDQVLSNYLVYNFIMEGFILLSSYYVKRPTRFNLLTFYVIFKTCSAN